MIKNILSVLVFLFSIFFFLFVGNVYFSEKEGKKIKNNRVLVLENIKKDVNKLPILGNDTSNIIEFNSGFENSKIKIERNFWKLFKKND
jgi:hypothetical protein